MKLIAAAIAPNPRKPQALAVAQNVESFLKAHNIKILAQSGSFLGAHPRGHIVITIGGDGTILHNKNKYALPFFAIGSDHSYICQGEYGNWEEALFPIIRNGYGLDRRLMLSSKANGKRLPDSLNEVVITRVGLERLDIADYELALNGNKYSFRADGLMIATPTGSTGWAYSYGAPDLPSNSRDFIAVGMGVYRRRFGIQMIGDGSTARIIAKARKMLEIVIDGQILVQPGNECVLKVWKSGKDFYFVKAA